MKKRKIISVQLLTADQLLSLLGDSLLEDLSRQVQADKWVIKLETVTVFKLILYSILDSERLSLRLMAEQFSSVPFQLLEQSVVGQKTAHSSIRDRLVKIKVSFFERLYERTRSLLAAIILSSSSGTVGASRHRFRFWAFRKP